MIVGRSPWMTQVLKNGDECRAVWNRKGYFWTQQPGVCKRIKKRLNRRYRRKVKIDISNFLTIMKEPF